jgi:hypothetical protein
MVDEVQVNPPSPTGRLFATAWIRTSQSGHRLAGSRRRPGRAARQSASISACRQIIGRMNAAAVHSPTIAWLIRAALGDAAAQMRRGVDFGQAARMLFRNALT